MNHQLPHNWNSLWEWLVLECPPQSSHVTLSTESQEPLDSEGSCMMFAISVETPYEQAISRAIERIASGERGVVQGATQPLQELLRMRIESAYELMASYSKRDGADLFPYDYRPELFPQFVTWLLTDYWRYVGFPRWIKQLETAARIAALKSQVSDAP